LSRPTGRSPSREASGGVVVNRSATPAVVLDGDDLGSGGRRLGPAILGLMADGPAQRWPLDRVRMHLARGDGPVAVAPGRAVSPPWIRSGGPAAARRPNPWRPHTHRLARARVPRAGRCRRLMWTDFDHCGQTFRGGKPRWAHSGEMMRPSRSTVLREYSEPSTVRVE